VIVLSDETNREEEFFQAGVRDVLPRGVDDRRLIARIHVQLRLKDRIDGLKQLGGPSQVIGEPKDNLTKLSLFPEMERRIEAEIARATTNHPFSCCLIHLDQFIWVNLHRGYMSGDVLLLELARLLRESLPPAGLAARFSAGQLALVLTDATRAQAQTWAEQFRDKVREYPFTGVDIGQAITVSIGMVTFPEEQSDRGDALLHLLVQRTELAVAQGGNCIVGSSL
jgi:diguanylate cyclase (GGDEF)-like protein